MHGFLYFSNTMWYCKFCNTGSFNLDKTFESYFGRVVCLPGCMTMFRAEMLASDEFYFQVLKRFAALPEQESLVGHISKEKGEVRLVF
jgi:hypothetical protein